MFKWIKQFFRKSSQTRYAMPSWEEIIEVMYDKSLVFADEVACVMYSRDKSKRFVILKSEHGFYKYIYEEIEPFDEEDLLWIKDCPEDVLPAYWGGPGGNQCSFYGSFEDAVVAIQAEPTYKEYF